MIYDDIGYFSPAGFQITGNVQKPVKIPEKNMFTIWATRPVNIRAHSLKPFPLVSERVDITSLHVDV
jgi:hypothetical protein